MPMSFATFKEGQTAARRLAAGLKRSVLLVFVPRQGWQVRNVDGSPIDDVARKLAEMEASVERDPFDVDDYWATREEHESINADYYREQRLIHEGSHEEYVRYLYGP